MCSSKSDRQTDKTDRWMDAWSLCDLSFPKSSLQQKWNEGNLDLQTEKTRFESHLHYSFIADTGPSPQPT